MSLNEFILAYNIQPADGIRVKKRFLGFLDHYLVYLGKYNRQHFFIARTFNGVELFTGDQIQDYLPYFVPKEIKPFTGTDWERRQAVQRALKLKDDRSYNLLANNCEHFFNEVQHGVAYSQQTRNLGAGLILGGAILTLNNLAKDEDEDPDADLKALGGLLLAGLGTWAVAASKKEYNPDSNESFSF